MVLVGDPDAGGEETGDDILFCIQVEFKKGLFHGYVALPAGMVVAVGAGDDGMFYFQFGEQADLIGKGMSYE